METRASYVMVGAFALAVIVGAAVFILWLGNLSLDREWNFYNVIFNEPVMGLSVGSGVQYNGILVGEVRRLTLATDDPRKAIATIRLIANTPVRTDTEAQLAFTGLTGVAVIQLTGGTPGAPPLVAAERGEIPEIVAKGSALQALLASGGDIMTSVNDVVTNVSEVLNDENVASLATSLRNIETVTSGLAARTDEIDTAIAEIASAASAFNRILASAEPLVTKLDSAATGAEQLFADEAPALLNSTRASLEALQKATAEIAAIVEANRVGLDSFARDGLPQVAPALSELRSSIRSIRRLVDRLEQDPGLLLQRGSAPTEFEAR